MINTNARYGGLGAHTAHLSMSFFGSSFVCKNGQKKNGRCKKAGKRRRRDESGDLESGDDTDMICLLKTPYDIIWSIDPKMETIKERLKINSKRFYT